MLRWAFDTRHHEEDLILKKVLVLFPSLDEWNGQTKVLFEYYRNLKDKFDFDFAIHKDYVSNLEKEAISNGSKVFHLPSLKIKNFFKLKREIRKIFRDNHYDVVHSNSLNTAFMFFSFSKEFGFKCVLHNHTTTSSDSFIKRIINKFLYRKSIRMADKFLACSEFAGKYAFKNRDFVVIHNAIDLQRYQYNPLFKEQMLSRFSIDSTKYNKIIGHIGRFCGQKNQLFLLDIIEECSKKHNDYLFIFVGKQNKYRKKFEKLAKERGLEKNILVLDPFDEAFKMYSLFDLFVFPSTYEGLGNVVIEAQATCCPVICSNNVPTETNVSGDVAYLPLNQTKWIDSITNFVFSDRGFNQDFILEKMNLTHYSISSASVDLAQVYEDC